MSTFYREATKCNDSNQEPTAHKCYARTQPRHLALCCPTPAGPGSPLPQRRGWILRDILLISLYKHPQWPWSVREYYSEYFSCINVNLVLVPTELKLGKLRLLRATENLQKEIWLGELPGPDPFTLLGFGPTLPTTKAADILRSKLVCAAKWYRMFLSSYQSQTINVHLIIN